MKIISVLSDNNEELYIHNFGFQSISADAHWGRGERDVYILHYVLTGAGYFNGSKVNAAEGFYIRPHELHEYHSSKSNPWTYFWVVFTGTKAGEITEKYVSADKNGIFGFNTPSEILNLKDIITSGESTISSAAALGYFYLLMSFSAKRVPMPQNRYVEEAKKYMQINLYRNFRITEIAKSVGISDRYLYNLFMKHEHCSTKAYLNGLRLKMAKSLLRSTSLRVGEIAISVGFDDVLAFSRFFKEQSGCSPSEYRTLPG